ncbi:MAG TPA: hypothetical protein VI818_07115 [Candidatus Thermoplasmatota archaeon]|nr:hypothetical protein [Candidatus Thermoplasmatota archaeon]
MSHLESGRVTCSMCYTVLDMVRARPILTTRRLKSHEVYQCPQCGYLMAVDRGFVAAQH